MSTLFFVFAIVTFRTRTDRHVEADGSIQVTVRSKHGKDIMGSGMQSITQLIVSYRWYVLD